MEYSKLFNFTARYTPLIPWIAMGIETDSDIDYGRIFGPFPEVGQISKSFFIGLLTTDEHEEYSNIKINVNTAGPSVTWLPYIRAARTEEEQNMEAYTKNGQIYYRALRIIKAGEELLVWYSKDFCQILGIAAVKNQETHVCDFCGAKFKYPYPLMAHIKFRCTSACYGSTSLLYDTNKSHMTANGDTEQHKEAITHATKRTATMEEYSLPVKRLFEDKMKEINNNVSVKTASGSSTSVKLDTLDNELRESWSAFKKVEKSKHNDLESKLDSLPYPLESSLSDSARLKCQMELNRYMNNKRISTIESEKGIPQGFGMFMPSSWLPQNSFSVQQLAAQQAIHSKLIQFPPEKPDGNNSRQAPGAILDSGASQIQHNDFLNKQLILDELQNFQLSHFKATNPMVDKVLHTAATPGLLQRPMRTLGATQNWCAKCNASFRMTSDLVYHMRSHHKREFDPMKRKREEKLQCNVCQETFKERHHLTRHMTSHT